MSSVSFAHNFPLSHFSHSLIAWQQQSGRHNLPWQQTDPYLVWVSEIMLQQTQVSTVLDYYPRFIIRFPSVQSLAEAPIDDVTALWAGLGYYSRARNLHHAAQQVCEEFGGTFPHTRTDLEHLKGVGRSTAAAIAAFAFKKRETILDGNVKRVLCRLFALYGNPQDKAFENSLWELAEQLLPEQAQDMPSYTQGLMDLGATVCTRSKPKCEACPMQSMCRAHEQDLTAELPVKKTSVQVKQMPVYWLCVIDEKQRILLAKRPVKGIWSQLYCPPMINVDEWTNWLFEHDIADEGLVYLPPIAHKLTHRAMNITAAILYSNEDLGMVKNGQFYDLQAALHLGLPKPLQNLLPHLLTELP